MTKRRALSNQFTRPIVLGDARSAFILTATGLEVRGRPSFTEYEGTGDFIRKVHHASGFWLGDWLRYGESRTDWRERLSQAFESSGLSEGHLKNVRAVAGRVDPSRRRDDLEFALHAEVAPLSPDEQTQWLDRAALEGWTQRELRLEIRAARRRKVLEGQAFLEGLYRVVYADPPWLYGDRPPSGSGAQQHYPGMSVEAICGLPVAAHVLRDAVLFLWVPAPHLPNAFPVIEAWGFEYKTGLVWDKVMHGFGHYVEIRHEHLLIATRGSCTPDRPTPMLPSIQVERRSDVHSEKPETFRKLIERLYDGPYLELFGRKRVEGWSVFGNDAALWNTPAEEEATA